MLEDHVVGYDKIQMYYCFYLYQLNSLTLFTGDFTVTVSEINGLFILYQICNRTGI